MRAEEDTAQYHEDFVSQYEDVFAARAGVFEKSARQNRDYAAELRELLGWRRAVTQATHAKGGEPHGSPPFLNRRLGT